MYNAPRKPVKSRKLTAKPTKGRATPVPQGRTTSVPSVSTVKKTTVHQSYLNWYVKNAKSGKAPTKKQAGDWWSKKATPAERKRWGV